MTAEPSHSVRRAAARNSPPTRIVTSRLQARSLTAPAAPSERDYNALSRRGRSSPARCIRKSARTGPGSCPICGMALEPEQATRRGRAERGTADMTRRFCIGLALALPRLRPRHGRARPELAWLAPRGLELDPARARDARRARGRAGRSSSARRVAVRTGSLNMFTLIAMGTGVAWGYSVVAHVRARSLSARPFEARRRRRRSISRRRRSSPRSCCSGRCWSSWRASGPAARSARFSLSRRRPRARIVPDGGDEDVALDDDLPSATGCACGRARKSRSTARWSKARAPSTNRC